MHAREDSAYRERFRLTLAYKPVDRCPIDLGGTPQSTIESPVTLRQLAVHLGFAGEAPGDYDKFDRRILERFDIDFRCAGGIVPFATRHVRKTSDVEHVDFLGLRRRFSGKYWEIVGGPLHGATKDQVAAFELPTEDEMLHPVVIDWMGKAKALRENTPYVVVGEHPVFGVLELACWLCGYDHIMMMMALDAEFIHLLFGKILGFQKTVIRHYYGLVGPHLHITTSGDDFGTQRELFMSPKMWREFVKPYFAERIAYTARFTDAVYMHHSCGSIFDIVPDLIEIGVRVLNPIQPAAAGMAPERLRDSYGGKIVFHGGVDTQELLPSNDAGRIYAAVRNILAVMRPEDNGGYILAPAHNIQTDVAPEAVATMYAAALGEPARGN